MTAKRTKGTPPKYVPPIPDTFDNVIKALVRPVKPPKGEQEER